MAFTNEQVLQWFLDNPNATDAQIAQTAAAAGVSAQQLSQVTGVPVQEVQARAQEVGVSLPATSASVSAPTSAFTAASTANNILGGVILAGDSWLAGTENTRQISEQVGQPVTNVAVGGFTTQDTINQLNSFLQSGGQFAPNSTVMLDVGGNDLLQGTNTQVVKNNLQQLVSTLGNNGVNVVLSGAPDVNSVSGVTGSTNLKINNIFKDVAKNNNNVTLVDSMAGLLNQKNLVDETGFHLNAAGQTAFNAALSNAYLESQGQTPIKYSEQAIKDFIVNNNLTLDQALALAPSFSVSADRVRSALTNASTTNTSSSQATTTANTWNYNDYVQALKTGGDLGVQVQRLATQDPTLASNTARLFGEIIDQQNKGSSQFWAKGNTASTQAAAADFALRLAENGISSLSQLGQVTIEDPSMEGPPQQITINKATGQPLPRPELLGRGQRGLDIDYNLVFAADGTVIPFTSDRQSSWMNFRENTLKPAAAFALTAVGAPLIGATVAPGLAAATQGAIGGAIAGGGAAALTGNNVLQGALLGGAGGYFQGANSVAPGLGPQTDASFIAADAAQLAAQGFNEATIAQVLGASGYASGPAAALAASMAVNGLDVNMMTQQLNALSTNTGLMSQTGSSADFLAADALQLQGQLGNNFAAIEQNLIASGVDPLIAADISQQLAFNPGLTQTQLATNLATSFGNNIYDVNMATTYPTSVLPGAGGLLSDVAGTTGIGGGGGVITGTTGTTTGTGTAAGTTAGLTSSQISNLVRAGLGLAGTTGAVRAVSGAGTTNASLQAPTQGMPTYTPDYYQQLQQYYNSYLPQTPRDVVTPLQQWYNSRSGA